MKEQWKRIEGYDYSVSSMGQVRNNRSGRILKSGKNNCGYLVIVLCKNGKRKTFSVHRLVTVVFVPNPENKPEVNHKNLVKTDNQVENLEWVTCKENNDHAKRNGIKFGAQVNKKCGFQKNHKLTRGSKCGMAKLNENQVLEIRRLYATGNYSQRELGKNFDISQIQIGLIVNNKNWKHI